MTIKHIFFTLSLIYAAATFAGEGSKVNYEKNTKLDFEAKAVDGQFQRPEGHEIDGEKNLEFDSMMSPRSHFKKEMKRSTKAVR